MDRRCSKFSHEALAELLRIDGQITHVRTNPATNTVEVFWLGSGSFQVAEGQEAMVRSPNDWRRAELEQELKNEPRT